jgi:DNA-binding NtrC family response regulator
MADNARILVVDDDPTIRKSMAILLKGSGYTVDVAENGKEAIEKSYSNFYNLALIDMRLPDMDGSELLTKLRETTPKMVKIIITGYAALGNAVDSVNNGADGYVIKPADMEKLLTLIDAHLKKQQEMKQFAEEKVADFVKTKIASLRERRAESSEPEEDVARQ